MRPMTSPRRCHRPRAVALLGGLVLLPLAQACNEPHAVPLHVAPAAKAAPVLGSVAALSGSWFDPRRSGEGIALQVLPDGRAVAAWFTYPPEGQPGEQAWLVAADGVFDGQALRFANVFRPRGGVFGEAFDPTQVVNEPWGALTLRFADCERATLEYTGPAGWGSGTRSLDKFTAPDQLDCRGNRTLTAAGARAPAGLRARSGSWFVPSRSGEGWLVEDIGGGLSVLTWFTYGPDGRQAWLTGAGAREGDRLVVDLVQTRGTRFGDAFDANAVERLAWGRVEIDFARCDAATLRYSATRPGFGAASRAIVRLVGTAGAECVDDFRERTLGDWREHAPMPAPAQSEIATAVLDGRIHVLGGFGDLRGFKRYDVAADRWQRLPDLPAGRHHAAAFAFDGAIFLSGGALTGGGDQLTGGFRFDPATGGWTPRPQLPFNFGSHAAVLHGRAWIGNEDGSLQVYDPRSDAVATIAPASSRPRDHSQVLAWLGEIWMIGGRAPETTSVSIYDPVSGAWREGPSLNRARGGFAAAVVDGHLVVAGGEVFTGGVRLEPSVEVLAPGANAWRLAGTMPLALHGVGGAGVGGRFYLLGGSTVAASAGGGNPRTFSAGLAP